MNTKLENSYSVINYYIFWDGPFVISSIYFGGKLFFKYEIVAFRVTYYWFVAASSERAAGLAVCSVSGWGVSYRVLLWSIHLVLSSHHTEPHPCHRVCNPVHTLARVSVLLPAQGRQRQRLRESHLVASSQHSTSRAKRTRRDGGKIKKKICFPLFPKLLNTHLNLSAVIRRNNYIFTSICYILYGPYIQSYTYSKLLM